jgi:hypothetical protein
MLFTTRMGEARQRYRSLDRGGGGSLSPAQTVDGDEVRRVPFTAVCFVKLWSTATAFGNKADHVNQH